MTHAEAIPMWRVSILKCVSTFKSVTMIFAILLYSSCQQSSQPISATEPRLPFPIVQWKEEFPSHIVFSPVFNKSQILEVMQRPAVIKILLDYGFLDGENIRSLVSPDDVRWIKRCSQLEVLVLRDTRFDNTLLEALADLPNLKAVAIPDCQFSRDSIQAFRDSKPKCIFRLVPKHATYWVLRVEGTKNRTAHLAPRIVLHENANDSTVDGLSEFPDIERIAGPVFGDRHAPAPINITNRSFKQFSKFKHLKEIVVQGVRTIDDTTLSLLIDCPVIELIDIRGSRATEDGAKKFEMRKPDCRVLVGPLPIDY